MKKFSITLLVLFLGGLGAAALADDVTGTLSATVTGPAATSTPVATSTPTVNPPPVTMPVGHHFDSDLKSGRSGDDVRELQKRLSEEGVYHGPVTGYFGALTAAAVKAFQKKEGVPANGTLDASTREKLNGGSAAGVPTADVAALRAQVAALQAQLLVLLQRLAAMMHGGQQ